MNIRFLETVVWLAELRNFRVTADRMNITPAAISNRISAVEQDLGVRLFDRDMRDVGLTPEGEIFVEGAREIVARYDDLITRINADATQQGTVRLGVLPAIALTLLPGVMQALRARFPFVRVRVTTDSSFALLQRLERRELDIIVGFHGQDDERHQIVPLCTFGMFWVASPDFPLAQEPVSRDELPAHPIISYEVGTTNHRRMIDYLPQGSGVEAVAHYSNSLGTTINLIAAGVGISVIPPVVIQSELRSGILRVLDVRPVFPAISYSVVWLNPSSSRLVLAVSGIVREVAADFCALYDDSLARID